MQSYASHRRMDPAFHYVAMPLALVAFVVALAALIHRFSWTTLLPLLVTLVLLLTLARLRRYATGLQDRIIRSEENLRHFVLAGALLDPRLTLPQIIALRFASDAEFPALARRAAEEGTRPDDLRRAVQQWRADHLRV